MDRLTKRIDDNHACFVICEKECPDWVYEDNPACMCTAGRAALKKLLRYEDTGLTPEQIQELKDRDMDKMSMGVDKGYIPPWVMEIVKRHLSDPVTDTNVWDGGWIPCSERMPETYKPHAESSDGKRMREREEFFAGNDFLTKRFMEVK